VTDWRGKGGADALRGVGGRIDTSEKLPYKWLVNFLITNENAFVFDVH
jgi:hypothetical protein